MMTRRRIESAGHIECDDLSTLAAQLIDCSDRRGDTASWLSLKSGSEQRVYNDRSYSWRGIADTHGLAGGAPSRFRIGRLFGGRRGLDHGYFYAVLRKLSGDDPPVAAIVAGTGEDRDAVPESLGVAALDFAGGTAACALHENARRSSSFNCRAIALR